MGLVLDAMECCLELLFCKASIGASICKETLPELNFNRRRTVTLILPSLKLQGARILTCQALISIALILNFQMSTRRIEY